MKSTVISKPVLNLNQVIDNAGIPPLQEWITCNTALLVIHGIGNQDPMETIDQFGRGLLTQFGDTITVSHRVASKKAGDGDIWFDNYLRVSKDGSNFYLDIYEYYWANYTRDKATYVDLSQWLNDVAKGANDFYFYDEDKLMGKAYGDHSIFFDKEGNFRGWLYKFFIRDLPKFFMLLGFAKEGLYKVIARLPLIGAWGAKLLESAADNFSHHLIDVISEVTIYNTNDEKSRFYPIRCQILDGAVNAIRYLIEHEGDELMAYPKVLIAGHSLGSQISFDAINRINLLINKEQISIYDKSGAYLKDPKRNITDQLSGLVTFGSPLDKIAFFLRMNVPPEQYLRDQMVNNYHGFKQQNWSLGRGTPKIQIQPAFVRLLDEMKWRNYYDDHDYVSGGLDYYQKVANVNCKFKSKWYSFTHSNYWGSADFHQDIIREFFH